MSKKDKFFKQFQKKNKSFKNRKLLPNLEHLPSLNRESNSINLVIQKKDDRSKIMETIFNNKNNEQLITESILKKISFLRKKDKMKQSFSRQSRILNLKQKKKKRNQLLSYSMESSLRQVFVSGVKKKLSSINKSQKYPTKKSNVEGKENNLKIKSLKGQKKLLKCCIFPDQKNINLSRIDLAFKDINKPRKFRDKNQKCLKKSFSKYFIKKMFKKMYKKEFSKKGDCVNVSKNIKQHKRKKKILQNTQNTKKNKKAKNLLGVEKQNTSFKGDFATKIKQLYKVKSRNIGFKIKHLAENPLKKLIKKHLYLFKEGKIKWKSNESP